MPIGRRAFLKFCSLAGSLLALPQASRALLPDRLSMAERLPVIWLSLQECTGCTEAFTRAHTPSLEKLILDFISLDYHHTLQAASGVAAERARIDSARRNAGDYLLVVDGSIALGMDGACSTIAGETNLSMLHEMTRSAAAVMAIGSCAAFGGLPAASPNPTGATGVADLMLNGAIAAKPLINLPGCPPLPLAISSTLAHLIAFGDFPALDDHFRPLAIYGKTVHERCPRYAHYIREEFAGAFDDEGARKGWCLFKLGCKGPVTHNACATLLWNDGTSFPVASGHPCIGCSEPGFWDRGPLYTDLDRLIAASGRGAEDGRLLYEDNCIYCHSSDASDLATAADDLPAVFTEKRVRAHGRFAFSTGELQALAEYVGKLRRTP